MIERLEIWDKIDMRVIWASIASGLTWLFGGWNETLTVLIVLIVVDYITGVLSAIVNRELSANVGYKGIVKKVMILLVVVVGIQIDGAMQAQGVVSNIVIYFFIANEGLSVLENVTEAGIPIPSKLKEVLKIYKEEKK